MPHLYPVPSYQTEPTTINSRAWTSIGRALMGTLKHKAQKLHVSSVPTVDGPSPRRDEQKSKRKESIRDQRRTQTLTKGRKAKQTTPNCTCSESPGILMTSLMDRRVSWSFAGCKQCEAGEEGNTITHTKSRKAGWEGVEGAPGPATILSSSLRRFGEKRGKRVHCLINQPYPPLRAGPDEGKEALSQGEEVLCCAQRSTTTSK